MSFNVEKAMQFPVKCAVNFPSKWCIRPAADVDARLDGILETWDLPVPDEFDPGGVLVYVPGREPSPRSLERWD